MSQFAPSTYQTAIFQWVTDETGHALVDAAAGAGKSTTLVRAAALLPKRTKALFCAFNRHIAKELGEKLKEASSKMECRTIHGLGRGALVAGLKRGQLAQSLSEPDARKYARLADTYILTTARQEYSLLRAVWLKEQEEGLHDPEGQRLDADLEDEEPFPSFEPIQLAGYLRKLVDFRRLTLTEPTEEALLDLADHYDLSIEFDTAREEALFWPMLARGVEVVVKAGAEEYQRLGIIDYTDMVFLPIYLDLPPARYDWVMIDECQDLNACQLELVLRAQKPGARLLFCGDRNQSLYGFTGADTQSIAKIIARCEATVLPLSICYRCPSSHIELAQQVYANIEASPTAAPGIVSVIAASKANQQASAGDYIICRTNAPLVTRCMALIREGRKAIVLGKDLGKNFLDLLKKLSRRPGFAFRDLVAIAETYQREQEEILSKEKDNDLAIEMVRDKIATLKALRQAYLTNLGEQQREANLQGFIAYIEAFFAPEEDETGKRIDYSSFVVLCTVHKAKGLEANRVFIERPDLLPHPAAKKDWQREQEQNILYVALTRAKQELYFIDESPESIRLPEREGGPLTIVVVHGPEGETSVFLDEEPERGLIIPDSLDNETVDGEVVTIEQEPATPASNILYLPFKGELEVPLTEGRVSRIAAIEVLCPLCSGVCADPATGSLYITHDLVGHTIVCSRCKRACIVPLNAFNLDGNVVAREKPSQAVPNSKIEKKGRTKKERKSNAGAKTKGKEPRQPMQLSLDMRVIRTLKQWGVNASALFTELLNQYQPFLEMYAAVNDGEQPEDDEEDDDE